PTIVGGVDKDSPAERAGLRPGDRILEVDGKPVTKWAGMGSSVMWRIVRSEGAMIPIKFERDGRVMTTEATPVKQKTKAWQRASLRQILMDGAHTPIINQVAPNSPAERAGLRRGDEITEVNGVKLLHPAGLADYIEKHGAVPLTLKGMREKTPIAITVTPEIPLGVTSSKPRIGIVWDPGGGRMDLVRPGVTEQIVGSVDAMLSTFGALFSRKSDIKPQHLSGAIKIMN